MIELFHVHKLIYKLYISRDAYITILLIQLLHIYKKIYSLIISIDIYLYEILSLLVPNNAK